MQVQLLDLSQPGRSVFAYNKKWAPWCGLGQESRYRDQARVINNGYRDELRDFGCAKLKLSALAWVQSPNALVLGLVALATHRTYSLFALPLRSSRCAISRCI